MLHPNSTQSLNEENALGKREIWRRKVFDCYARIPEASWTDRQIIEALHAEDVNQVRPEITRLLEGGYNC